MKLWQGFGIAFFFIIIMAITLFFVIGKENLIEEKIKYVSSTEYIALDEGQTIIRLSNYRDIPITTANCTDTILYPNKSIFLSDTGMSLNLMDNYYHTFTVPTQDGVYETIVNCEMSSGRNISNAKTFHVSLFSQRMFSLMSSLNQSIEDYHLEEVELIQNLSDDMIQGFQDTITRINQTYDNLSLEITEFRSEVETNFSYVIELIEDLNTTIVGGDNQSHQEILSLLNIINQTTITTQSDLSTFQTETEQNFNNINVTILAIKQDTEYIIEVMEGINTTMNIQFENVTSLINNLSIQVQNNFEITQTNITEIKNLILDLNTSISIQYTNLTEIIYAFWNETTINYNILYNLTNLTEWEVSLILQYLNISTTDLSIYVTHNNCILGSTYLIDAEVRDYFNNILSSTFVWCNITTNFWGNDTMIYTPSIQKFRYTHLCEPLGTVTWEIECDWV